MQKFLIKASICVLLISMLAGAAGAEKFRVLDATRLPNGQALKAMYFYPHWWDPWKSDDTVLSADMQKIKDIGFNTICVDHEVSQAMDNDWGWVNREYRLARAQNLFILPWLQLQAADRQGLIKFSHLKLKPAVNQDKEIEEDYVNVRDSEFRDALVHYVSVYLDQYADDPAMLKIKIGNKLHPVVGLVLEAGWHDGTGLPLSFDNETNAYFRTWMKASHHDIKQLNKEWGTSYKSFDQIDPCDKKIFNYSTVGGKMSPAVREHMLFRARLIDDAFDYVARQVRKRHKDVLFVAEVPYPFGSSNPDAMAYHRNAASDRLAIEFSDIVFVRTLGNTVSGEEKKEQDAILRSPKQVVTAYRMMEGATEKEAIGLAVDAVNAGNGIAYYNWNERADSISAVYDKPDLQALLKTMNDVYDMLNNPEQRHALAKAALTAVPQVTGGSKPAEVIPVIPATLPGVTTPAPSKDGQIKPAPVIPNNAGSATTAPAPAAEAAPATTPARTASPAPAQQ